jgi:hypothetical protein
MTWTAAADAAVPGCARAAAACGFAGVRIASPGPGAVPTAARGRRHHPGRPARVRPRQLASLPRQREPGCVRRLHLLGADLAAPGWPSDPGREVP